MFKGSITALITPFRDGAVDWAALDGLIERQIATGSHGLVVCGTTGESPTLTQDEHKRIVERAVSVVKGRIPVIAGTGSNATAKTLEMTDHAKTAHADAALIVTPYYNKPTQEGLYAHYRTIAEAVNIPIIIYNIPGRCVVDMQVETMARLAKIPNIIGVKDATADLSRPAKVRQMIGPDFCQLSGEDATIYDFLEQGGHGCISVTSNIAVSECAALHEAWIDGNKDKAHSINESLMPLHNALFVETSPAPAKYAAQCLGLCTDNMRLPLVPASEMCRSAIDSALQQTGMITDNRIKAA